MKVKIFIIFIALIGLSACHHSGIRGNGDIKTIEKSVENFTSIEAGGAFRVYVKVGENPSLKIEAEENLMKYISTRVSGSSLIIDEEKNLNPKEQITIYVTTPELNRIVSSGASKVFAENINSDSFKLDCSGAGKVKLVGKANKFLVDLSGATDLDSFDFKCVDVDMNLSGASKAEIYSDGILKVDISGVGNVIYDGAPKNVYSDISGLGKLTSR